MGAKYVEAAGLEFVKLFEESGPSTPVFFILAPGVDPLKDVEKLGTTPVCFYMSKYRRMGKNILMNSLCAGLKLGFSIEQGTLHNVSLGQGQEEVAERALKNASKLGHWVILQVERISTQRLCYCSDCRLLFQPARSVTNSIMSAPEQGK